MKKGLTVDHLETYKAWGYYDGNGKEKLQNIFVIRMIEITELEMKQATKNTIQGIKNY